MRKRRCSLCGGKLVNNRCVECGLDNTQNDAQYKNRVNRSSCDGKTLTHVHNEVKPRVRKKPKMFKILYILFLIVMIVFVIWSTLQGLGVGGTYETRPEEEALYEDQDPYQYVTRELSEYGEVFETVLEPGVYQVGVHIPEGTYTAEPAGNYEGYIQLRDDENGIYYLVDFGNYEGAVWRQNDIRMYDGAVFEVPLGMRVKLYSENAQIGAMHGMENPLAEEVVLSGNAVAGEDFEPGVYDIQFLPVDDEINEYGEVICTPSIEDMENGVEEKIISFDECWDTEIYHNVLLASGTTVVIEDLGEIKIFPSKVISDLDYDSYYNE